MQRVRGRGDHGHANALEQVRGARIGYADTLTLYFFFLFVEKQ